MITVAALPPLSVRARRWGPRLLPGGGVHFRLWAPALERVSLLLDGDERPIPMLATGGGWYEFSTPRAGPGSHYWFVLEDGTRLPDPASHFQPEDVHGPSEVIDHSGYRWHEREWRGRPWSEAVIYELHAGCFTGPGTFRAAQKNLTHLARLAEDLQALVDAAHELDLMVILDVVYNHFGPEGNYLGRLAPQFFTKRHRTPWGDGINFDAFDPGERSERGAAAVAIEGHAGQYEIIGGVGVARQPLPYAGRMRICERRTSPVAGRRAGRREWLATLDRSLVLAFCSARP